MADIPIYQGATINGDVTATGKLKGTQATAAGEAPVLGSDKKIPQSLVNYSGYVPESRTINSKALLSDFSLGASDVGAIPVGGTLTKPLTVTGGNSASAGKLLFSQSGKGQITDSGTNTIFGFGDASNVTVGASSYGLKLYGSATKPTYNGTNLVLNTDISSFITGTDSTATDSDIGQTFAGHTISEFLLNTSAVSTYLSKTDATSTYLPKTGGTLTGTLTAQNNTAYTTKQVRNITVSTSEPSGGSNGDIWIQYE